MQCIQNGYRNNKSSDTKEHAVQSNIITSDKYLNHIRVCCRSLRFCSNQACHTLFFCGTPYVYVHDRDHSEYIF